MNSAGKVSVVDADGPTEEEQQVRRVPKRLRDELNGIVPGFGDELGRYLRNIGGSVDDEKSRERNVSVNGTHGWTCLYGRYQG